MEEKEVKTQVIEQKVEAEVFLIVEEPPTFPGGDQALYKWLGENLKYPEEAKELGIQGRVFGLGAGPVDCKGDPEKEKGVRKFVIPDDDA